RRLFLYPPGGPPAPSVVEVPAGGDFGDVAGADDEVAERLVGLAVAGVVAEQLVELCQDAFLADVVEIGLVEALAVEAAAQIDIVLARRAAGEADLGQVRAGAAVGAAGHADHDRLLGEPMPLDDGFQLGDQRWQVALALGHGQRSEEHTSELQSREKLVCRLLLEKKKKRSYKTSR